MQDDVTRFVKSIPLPATIILLLFCGGGMIFGVLGAQKAWRDGSRIPALFYGFMALAMGAMGMAIVFGYFTK